jgi:hypothetical protein
LYNINSNIRNGKDDQAWTHALASLTGSSLYDRRTS